MGVDTGYAMPRGLIILLGTAAAVITVAGIRAMAWLIGPMLLALVIVVVVSPVHRWLRRHGFQAWLATSILVILVYGVLISFVLVVVLSVARLAQELPEYTDRARELANEATNLAARFGLESDDLRQAASTLDPGKLVTIAGDLLSGIAGVTTSIVFLLALLLFFSVETTEIGGRLGVINQDRPQVHDALLDFARRTRKYIVVTTVFGLIVAVLDVIALAWLGIPLVVLWGVLSFVTNYIPNIGFIIGVAPPALLGLLIGGWPKALAVIVVYVVLNFIVQSLIQPRYVGDAVGLSTAMTFVSLVFWAWVLGALGVLLAIPATLLMMTVLVDTDPKATWAAALFGARARRKRRRRHRSQEAGGPPRTDGPDRLTVWRFASASGAAQAARTLESLGRMDVVTVADAAVVSWDAGRARPRLRRVRDLGGERALSDG
ncbi:MAG TPA: AI-2E family transporter, partial [Micromonosporaceae bacterium]|nr:AI-2E family transporter [Micromonosporaceae bacterium]